MSPDPKRGSARITWGGESENGGRAQVGGSETYIWDAGRIPSNLGCVNIRGAIWSFLEQSSKSQGSFINQHDEHYFSYGFIHAGYKRFLIESWDNHGT